MITTRLPDILPEGLQRLTYWRDLATSIAAGLDGLIHGVWQLAYAAMPGQNIYDSEHGGFPNIDALKYLGRDRRIPRGLQETPEEYAFRLRHYRELWRGAGTALSMLPQLKSLCSPSTAPVRIATDSAWYTLESDGTFKMQSWASSPLAGFGITINPDGSFGTPPPAAHPWDWDSQTVPAGGEFRFWVILYAPIGTLLPSNEGTYGDSGSWFGDGGLVGIESTLEFLASIRGFLDEWKPPQIVVPYVIVAFDPASFDPDAAYPSPLNPDGWWGDPWRADPGDPTSLIRSRLASARYIPGAPDDGVVAPLV